MNYHVMRSRVASNSFLLRKHIERILHQHLDDAFVPLYSMVTFSHTPYAEAMRRYQAQDVLLDCILDHVLNAVGMSRSVHDALETPLPREQIEPLVLAYAEQQSLATRRDL